MLGGNALLLVHDPRALDFATGETDASGPCSLPARHKAGSGPPSTDGSNLQVAATSSTSVAGQSFGEDRVDDLHIYATTAFQKGIVRLETAIGAERTGDAPDLGVLMSRHCHVALPRASLSPPPPLA